MKHGVYNKEYLNYIRASKNLKKKELTKGGYWCKIENIRTEWD